MIKEGDRVAVYGGLPGVVAHMTGVKGTVLSVDLSGNVRVRFDECVASGTHWTHWYVHAKQCRRLVKKERKRVWILNPDYAVGSAAAFFDKADAERMRSPGQEIQEFVQARKKT